MAKRSRTDDPTVSRLEERRRAANKASNASYTGRRREVIDAAGRLFAERGYEATTLTDIAEAVGIDRATLYYYFKAKTDIIGAAITDAMATTMAEVDEIMASSDDAVGKIGRLIRRLATAFEENYPFGSLYFQDDLWRSAEDMWTMAVRRDEARINQSVLSIIAAGQQEGTIRTDLPAELVFEISFGAVFYSYRWFKPGCGYDAGEVTRAFETILFQGLTPPVAPAKEGKRRVRG